MAKAGAPNTTGSQFFIGFTDTGLFAGFNPIGEVVEGLEILDLIEAVPVSGESPQEALYLNEVIVEGP
jgi:cyclophilin family peptidyl-prolyl cis-trans isomerase